MKLDPKWTEAIANAYEVATTLFGDPPDLRWEMRLLEERFGLELRIVVRRDRRPVARACLTEMGVLGGGMGEMVYVARLLRELKRAALEPVNWHELPVTQTVR